MIISPENFHKSRGNQKNQSEDAHKSQHCGKKTISRPSFGPSLEQSFPTFSFFPQVFEVKYLWGVVTNLGVLRMKCSSFPSFYKRWYGPPFIVHQGQGFVAYSLSYGTAVQMVESFGRVLLEPEILSLGGDPPYCFRIVLLICTYRSYLLL
jgi:hypothetical protein